MDTSIAKPQFSIDHALGKPTPQMKIGSVTFTFIPAPTRKAAEDTIKKLQKYITLLIDKSNVSFDTWTHENQWTYVDMVRKWSRTVNGVQQWASTDELYYNYKTRNK